MARRHGSLAMRSVARSAIVGAALLACGGETSSTEAPAKVTGAIPETHLATVALSDSAVIRLGIETAPVDTATLVAVFTAGGEVMVAPGRLATLVAPVAGTVLPPAGGTTVPVGADLSRGQELLRLAALPPDREMLRSTEAVAVAEARLREAESEATRIESLWADRLVSARDRERATAELTAARAAAVAARSQQAVVHGAPDSGAGAAALRIVAPDGGVLQRLLVVPGQAVAAGTPLAEVARLDELWVRVPVYAGDATDVARGRTASVVTLGGRTLSGRPVAGPRIGDPAAASVDLYYAVPGSGLRPGERVRVAVPRTAPSVRALVVPHAAITYDIHGNAWVYEEVAPHTYARRRVDVDRVEAGLAVLTRGPVVGTRIVVAGVAELFGTEFGGGK